MGRDGLHNLAFKRLAQLMSLLRRNLFRRRIRSSMAEDMIQAPQLRSIIANEYIMPRTLDPLRASVQGHLEKHPTQTIIHSQTVASTGSCEAVRAVFSGVKREPRRASKVPSVHTSSTAN
jgi:hypothetical protein